MTDLPPPSPAGPSGEASGMLPEVPDVPELPDVPPELPDVPPLLPDVPLAPLLLVPGDDVPESVSFWVASPSLEQACTRQSEEVNPAIRRGSARRIVFYEPLRQSLHPRASVRLTTTEVGIFYEGVSIAMSKVFVSMGMSLDGCVAEPNRSIENMGSAGWMSLHQWVFAQKAFREHLGMPGEGGETGDDNRFLESVFGRTGVSIMGKKMFNEGERGWPEEPPFRSPVFVLTHEVREPWERKGGTTFHFVNDGIEAALRRAREVAEPKGKDIRISGGADLVRQYLNAGLVDELLLSVAPTFLGNGLRLFDGIDANGLGLEILEALPSPKVTHLRYAVKKR